MHDTDEMRDMVRDHYAKVSERSTGCAPGCCAGDQSKRLGYSEADLAAAGDADLGLGCGNPTAIASLRPGETVLDLGAGGGFDAFLAARAVGPTGMVIGVDMTAEMLARARANARKLATTNVEFRLGEIEHLPVADAAVDVVLSNCVINLSPDKPAVFREAFRVLRVGGRLAISDVVAIAPIPDEVRAQPAAIASCIGGAATLDEMRRLLADAGFEAIQISVAPRSREIVESWLPGAASYLASAAIEARRGPAACCPPGCCP